MLIMDFTKLKKLAEISWIKNVVAESMDAQVDSNYRKCETAIEEEISAIKEVLRNGSENVASSVKGQYGNKVRETIKVESEKVNNF